MGKSLTQNLYYVDSDLCGRNIDSKNMGYPQREYGEDGLMLPWTSPFILMVDRGGCSFVQKVIFCYDNSYFIATIHRIG